MIISRTRFLLYLVAVLMLLSISKTSATAKTADKPVTLSFPREHSCGNLYYVQTGSTGGVSQPQPGAEQIIAQGNVTISASQTLLLVLNYWGVAHPAFLDNMSKSMIVQVDAHDLENVDNALMSHIGKLENLLSLHVNGTDLTDIDLKQLQGLTRLNDLVLNGTLVTGSGLAYLEKCPIKVLKMQTVDLSHGDLRALKNFKRCQTLLLDQTSLSDSALMPIGEMPAVAVLNLCKNKITDAGLSHLSGMKSLFNLNVSDTFITMKSLPTLQSIPNLNELILTQRQFRPGDLEKLKRALPHCRIDMQTYQGKVDPTLFMPLH